MLHPEPVSHHIAALDGVLIAARRQALAAIPLDAQTFDGFHLYDLDWSYRAARQGLQLGVVGNLLLVHASRGQYGDAWSRYAERFSAKHRMAPGAPRPSSFFGATFASAKEVRSFFSMLEAIDAEAQ